MKHSRPDPLAHLKGELAELERTGLFRRPADAATRPPLSFCSNDYLGLAHLPAPPVESGAGASRLIAGERSQHRALEGALAAWFGTEDALLFTSGYAANVGAVSALARPGDLIVSDALNHASLIDGARLSRARIAVTPHLDLEAVDRALAERTEQRALVVVESYYSMDADGPDLARLRAICDARGAALYVDEAHAIGVLGPRGRGRAAEAGVEPDVLVGTLGKSLGSQGAFVAGRTLLREWLWNRARSFVFSTGLAPVAAAAGQRALEYFLEHPSLQERAITLTSRLRDGLLRAGALQGLPQDGGNLDDGPPRLLGFGHVVPIVVGSPHRALRLAALFAERGIHAQAIRPPTVPAGGSRLRLTVTAGHSEADVDRAIEAFAWAATEVRNIGATAT